MADKKVLLTGGGTAGHVTPNIALLPALRERGYEVFYIGSHAGIEKQLIEKQGIRYYGVSSGKLRRYFESQWWYMPDPTWKPTDDSFTKHEWEMMQSENEEK